MDKHALSSVAVLLLLVATQAHIQSLRETTSSSSSSASSSIVDVTPSRTTISAGDPPLNRRGSGSEFSSYSHEDNLIEVVRIALLPRDVELPSSLSDPDSESVTGSAGCSSSSLPELISSSNDASSAIASQTEFIDDSHGAINIQGSNAVSSDETGMDVEALESSNSTSKRIIVTTTAPVIYVFSSSSLSVAAVSNSDDAGQSTTTPTSLDVVDHDGNYQYSAGTVTPNEERSDIESTALELSTSPDQVDDDEGKTPFTSTRSTASSGKKATSTSDQVTTIITVVTTSTLPPATRLKAALSSTRAWCWASRESSAPSSLFAPRGSATLAKSGEVPPKLPP